VVFIPEQHYLWDFWLVTPREWRGAGAPYHLYYLQAPRTLRDPALRHGMSTIGHAVSHDLRHWEPCGTALATGRPGSWDDYAIWTGSVIVRDGLAYLFYTGICRAERGLVQRIGLAVSADLAHWERHANNPLLEVDTRWYEAQSTRRLEAQAWRDPYVVYSAEKKLYYMFLSARANSGPLDGRGVIGLARSTDLLSWEALPPVSKAGDFTEMEVPQVLALNGRYYLLFCTTRHASARLLHTEGAGWSGTHYLVASSLTGPYFPLTDEPLAADAAGTYYAGKLVCDIAGLSDPADVYVLPDGRLQIDPQQLWSIQNC
jgi:beta-fructofuranosidase